MAFDTSLVGSELQKRSANSPIESLLVNSCKLLRFRYRPGKRAIFSYEIETTTNRSAHGHRRWVTGSLYTGNKSERLHRDLARQGVLDTNSGARADVGYLPKLGMLVEYFPADRRLTGLVGVASGPPAALQRVFRRSFGARGAWRIETVDAVPVRYRPHIGAVFRYEVAARSMSGQACTKTFYLKIYPDDQTTGLFEKSLCLAADSRHREPACGLTRPLAHLPEYGAIVWSGMPGHSLAQMLLAGTLTVDVVRQTVAALGRFHCSTLQVARRPARAIIVRETERATRQLRWACPDLDTDARAVAGGILDCFHDTVFATTHLDMKPEHVLIQGHDTSIIDVETVALSDPALDAGNLIARLWAAPEVLGADRSQSETAAQAFAACWTSTLPGNAADKLRAATALGFLKVARYAIEHQIPGWQGHAKSHLAHAKRALGGQLLASSVR